MLGEEAHIRSSKVTGPRYDATYPAEQLNEYENLVLLCPTHHTVIDKDKGRAWPTANVLEMKQAHEAHVDAAMGSPAKSRLELEVALAARIDRWEASIHLAGWEELSRRLNYVVPYVTTEQWFALSQTSAWLAGLDWPHEYPKLAAAFETHGAVLCVLVQHLTDVFVSDGKEHRIRRRHKERWFGGSDGERKYTEAISQFGVDDAVTSVLITELTRTVNLVIQAVNKELIPLYRFNDGPVQMIEGDVFWGLWSSTPRYDPLDWETFPRAYVLSDVAQRVRDELQGGDPRNGVRMDIAAFDPSLNGRGALGRRRLKHTQPVPSSTDEA
ncbi:hypothetical protein BFN01_07275 [Microbacterium sp. AR7-10]|nr:hypothetical protein BFN01_07275 [Microbacterium sp. AR7-10]